MTSPSLFNNTEYPQPIRKWRKLPTDSIAETAIFPESAFCKDLIKNDLAYSDEIQQEDILICENVQKGLKSKAYDKGRFSVKRETGVYHFQSLIKKHFIAE